MSQAMRFDVTIGKNHKLELEVPDVPEGPAEVIVITRTAGARRLTERQKQAIAYMLETPRTPTPVGTPTAEEMLREDRDR